MVEQTKGFANEINKSLDELVNEDTSMKQTRFANGQSGGKRFFDNGSNQSNNQKSAGGSQGGSFQKRNANKDRDGEDRSGFRGGQESSGYGRDRGGGHHRREGKFDDRRQSFGRGGSNYNHNDEREVNNSEYQRSMEGRRLFVSNLAFETQWKYLKDHMRQAGDVVRADIFEDQKGRSRGIGVVEFRNKGDMEKALNQLNETMLDGRKIFLKEDTQLHMLPPLMSNNKNFDNYGGQQSNNFGRRGGHSPDGGRGSRRGNYRSRSRERSAGSNDPQHSGRGDRSGRGGRPRLADKEVGHESKSLTIQKRDDQARESSSERTFPVHVSNLPFSVDREQLKEAFREFGKVLHASVSLDERGLSRGFGVIEFSTKEAADNSAKTMDKASFNKREVSVRAQYTT